MQNLQGSCCKISKDVTSIFCSNLSMYVLFSAKAAFVLHPFLKGWSQPIEDTEINIVLAILY